MALEQKQKEAILANLSSVLSSEESQNRIANYIVSGDITWEELSNTGMLTPAQRAALQAIVDSLSVSHAEDQLWQQTQMQHTIAAYQSYMAQYPTGKYVSLAQTLIAGIIAQQAASQKYQYIEALRNDINAYRSEALIQRGIQICDLENAGISIPNEIKEIYSEPCVKLELGEMPTFIEEGQTEVYFWGITGSGKTCTLASILSVASIVEKGGGGVNYFQKLTNIFDNGVGTLPPGTQSGNFQSFSFDLLDEHKKHYPMTIVDLPGELISDMGAIYAGDKTLYEKDSVKKFLSIIKDTKNPKYHFFIVDVTNTRRDSEGLLQFNYLKNLANFFTQTEPDIFNDKTSGVAILVTKSDMLSSDETEQLVKAIELLNEKFEKFITPLKSIAHSKGLISSEMDNINVIPFSIGKVYFRDKCVHNAKPAMKVINFILENISAKRKERKFRKFLRG